MTSMAIAKNHANKKSLRKSLKAGAVNRSERDLALAREEEEAIAQMVKDFRKREQKRKKRTKATAMSVSTARAQFGQIIRRITDNNERFVITHRGKPQVVMISINDFTKLTGVEP
jgi:prevent-host-death family protein